MPVPRVFVSSTCYDLASIRENLRSLILRVGYDPVLSDHDGGLFLDPTEEVIRAAVGNVQNSNMFVLIIGGTFGTEAPDEATSVTNIEYREAAEHGIPIFTLVQDTVLQERRTYDANRGRTDLDAAKINYPAVDSTRIFDFIDEVTGNTVNNAIQGFTTFADIEEYLLTQWGGLMHSFLTSSTRAQEVANTLEELKDLGRKIEAILTAVNPDEAQTVGSRFELMSAARQISGALLQGAGASYEDLMKAPEFETLTDFLRAIDGRTSLGDNAEAREDFQSMRKLSREDLASVLADVRAEGHTRTIHKATSSRKQLVAGLEALPDDAEIQSVSKAGDRGVVFLESGDLSYRFPIDRNDRWYKTYKARDGDPPLLEEVMQRVRSLFDESDDKA